MTYTSYYDYKQGQQIAAEDYSFYALIQAAMRQADSTNIIKLKSAFPEVWEDLKLRYDLPGGLVSGEEIEPDDSFLDQEQEGEEEQNG